MKRNQATADERDKTCVDSMIPFLLFFGISANIMSQDTVGLTNSIILSQHTQNFADLWSMGVEVTTKDKLECAMYCLYNQTGCQSFSFDLQTGTCHLGYCIIPWPNSTSPTVQLYQVQQPKCESAAGFQVYTSGNISACLFMSQDWMNFTDSATQCEALNSTLMSLKFVEKLEILKKNAADTSYIGLDDMKTEGAFTWHDDHTVIQDELKPRLFNPGEPNNGVNEEDCVNFEPGNDALNDVTCSDVNYYICEKTCFYF
uniref:C-type lectin domain-containing protein n=1 Tax=Biomphalaria glabrata TaxID=6526 RepID=A0A2C9LGM4_BIOGL